MNYYIQGNAAKADQIKAAFEKKGIDVLDFGFADKTLVYCSIGGAVQPLPYSINLKNILHSHPDYKELELPAKTELKVGDWIAGIDDEGDMATEKIVSFSHNKVLLVDTDGCHTEYPKTELNRFHLWTIADAQDGDVLATNSIICVFKKLDKDGYYIISPCIYTVKDGLEVIDDENDSIGSCGFKPATKEDRELLFRKMKEAGYEWDSNKKELKKIKSHYNIKNFQPKQWVLVRDDDEWEWSLTRFSYLSNGSASLFVCINGASFQQCIPYEGNEHLLGTTDMPSEEYINW